MMKVVGEEGTTTEDYIEYLKSDFLDSVYFQQNSFDEVDNSVSVERQTYTLEKVLRILGSDFDLNSKDDARSYFNSLRPLFIDWNYSTWKDDSFTDIEKKIDELYAQKNGKLQKEAAALLKDGE